MPEQDARSTVKMHLRTGCRAAAGGFDKSGMSNFFGQASKDTLDPIDTRYPIRCLVIFTGTVEFRKVSDDKGQSQVPKVFPGIFNQAM